MNDVVYSLTVEIENRSWNASDAIYANLFSAIKALRHYVAQEIMDAREMGYEVRNLEVTKRENGEQEISLIINHRKHYYYVLPHDLFDYTKE